MGDQKNHKYFKGIDETMSVDDCTHSFFGVSKSYGDLLVQEYGKNAGLKTVCFRRLYYWTKPLRC